MWLPGGGTGWEVDERRRRARGRVVTADRPTRCRPKGSRERYRSVLRSAYPPTAAGVQTDVAPQRLTAAPIDQAGLRAHASRSGPYVSIVKISGAALSFGAD